MDIEKLSNSLHYLNVKELEDLCKKYDLPTHVPAPLLKKPSLIQAIVVYVQTGNKTQFKNLLPMVSRATSKVSELTPQAKILFGSYKSDLKTRLFLQKLIGPHFYFTAYGFDWVKQRWMDGNPPTYQEFADFWQKEHLYRKEHKNTPLKEEWAYLNFLRDYRQQYPHANKQEALSAWETTRGEKVNDVYNMLRVIE
ncbi:MAG: hypothetical protein M1114_03080 [Candidatus Dependentiae bacterium]|nr:hypothetical protein [Candidatus Dependentiae bacterium]